MKLAILDLGSNTTKLLVVESQVSEELIAIHQKSLSARMNLVNSSGETLEISRESLADVLAAFSSLLKEARDVGSDEIICVGTEALRRASNSGVLIEEIKKEGVTLRILSGEEEAKYVSLGLSTDPKFDSSRDFIGFDLGGGSIEILISRISGKLKFHSLPLGAVRLTKRFFGTLNHAPSSNELNELRGFAAQLFEGVISEEYRHGFALAGIGGAMVFARKIMEDKNNIEITESSEVSYDSLSALLEELISMDLDARITRFPQLPRNRADILPAGIAVILELMGILNAHTLYHSLSNIRFGVAREFFDFQADASKRI